MTTTNTYGRQVVLPLTNKSGGGVIAGDVVIIDTANNDAFTTSTAGAVTGTVGVAQETIASNAIGRVLTAGYAALVNTSASVTRGNFGKTHTVVKQAVDAGSSRVAGTFCQFLTGGTTPDAVVFPSDLGAGSGLTDPMTTRGDIIVRNSSNVTARLAVGATAGMSLTSDGTDVSWVNKLAIQGTPSGGAAHPANLTSTSYVDLDATNLKATVSGTGPFYVCAFFTIASISNSERLRVDIAVDGTGLNGANGIFVSAGAATYSPVTLAMVSTGTLAGGSHTIAIQAKVTNTATATFDGLSTFSVFK